MCGRIKTFGAAFFLTMFSILAGSAAMAEDSLWHVSKSSGDFWVTTSGIQQASLTEGDALKPGAGIRTGRNGRVLLVRGEETILVSPNSSISIPAEVKEGLSTSIFQKAGSIILEVKKRDDKHFEVVTPYLAAVVKGTQFRVTVNKNNASVGVIRGQVEVADFKSGQYALVLPGQAAKVSAQGTGGLSLSGSGVLSPIQQGKPGTSPVNSVPMPKAQYSVQTSTPNTQPLRITAALGEVKLDFQKVTKGLAHAPSVVASLKSDGDRRADSRVGSADGKAVSNDKPVSSNGFGNDPSPGNAKGFAGIGNGSGSGNSLSAGNGQGHWRGRWKGWKGYWNGHGHGHGHGHGKK